VRANGLGEVLGVDTGKQGRIVVDEQLRIPGQRDVFAAGDAAAVSAGPGASPLPMLAPVAIQSGRHAGIQVARLVDGQPLQPFHFRDKGVMAVLGRGDAVAELPLLPGRRGSRALKLRFGGRFAWLLWLGVHIVYLIGFRNRLQVLVDWGWNYFTSRGTGAIMISDADASR
jgi:NADH dehydrogenase